MQYEETLKKHSLEKWENDFEMVLHEVNSQAESIVELVDNFESEHTDIAVMAIQKWSYEGYLESNIAIINELSRFDIEQILNLHCDWEMVLYEYENQVEAKNLI
jgi:hypothetical protein